MFVANKINNTFAIHWIEPIKLIGNFYSSCNVRGVLNLLNFLFCFRTNAARIKKQEKAKSSQQQNFNLPSINIIDETLFRNHDTTRTKSSGGTTTTNIPTIRSVPEHSYQSSIDRTNPFVNDSSSSEQPSNQEEIQSSHYEMVTSKEAYLKNNIQNEFINKKLDQNNGQTCCDQVVPSINPFEVVISSFDSSNENKYANESTTDPGQLEMTPKSYHEFKF